MSIKTQFLFAYSILVITSIGGTSFSYAEENRWGDIASSLCPMKSGASFAHFNTPPQSDWYIVLHDEPMFRGSPVHYEGAVANLDTFNKRVQSVVIGEGVWELCDGLNFTGYCITLDQSVPDLHLYGMHNRITSVRPISVLPSEDPIQSDFHIVLFDKIMYHGYAKEYDEAAWNLYGFNKHAQSVVIERGVWELCECKHFTGRCITPDKNAPDLRAYNMLNLISSVRPVRPESR